ncbi:MAG: SEL1-like repeat protein [Alphaproteobacteria bacterium]|jgi:TPR repeat protein|nr:SEL1-like repeat protein [Alphaproteobacteria bacterium]
MQTRRAIAVVFNGVAVAAALSLPACVTLKGGDMVPPEEMGIAWTWVPDPDPIVPEAGEDVELALRYLNGDGVPRNPDLAQQLLRGAAERGEGEAAFLLGRLYEEGIGVEQNPKEAMRWIETAAGREHDVAQFRMGIAYYRGEGRPLNPARGVRWFKQAAVRGHADAQYHLAIAYHLGRGTPRNEIDAVHWLEAAAAQNHLEAQYLAGDAYSDGWGTERDRSWAARWYGLAAMQGMAKAQYKLALFHLGGLGVPRDLVKAYTWASIAARSGVPDALRLVKTLTQDMPAADVDRATRQAGAWKPTPESKRNGAAGIDRPSVAFAQYALAQIGYKAGPVDGYLGTATRQALVAYQSASGLAVDGRLSTRVLRRLKRDRLKRRR